MLTKPLNVRSSAMWDQIWPKYSFHRKTVIDYGFGGGDFLLYAAQHSAIVSGVEKDFEKIFLMQNRMKEEGIPLHVIPLHHIDLDLVGIDYEFHYDQVAFCFSVLPYLKDPDRFLAYLHKHHPVAFLECQYAGDGPGFPEIEDDKTMRKYLSKFGWENIDAIGKTFVEGRDKWRTIWRLIS